MKAVIALMGRGNSPAKGSEQGYSALAGQVLRRGGSHEQ